MNANSAYKFNVTNINLYYLILTTCPYLVTFIYQEEFKSLATSISALVTSVKHS